MVFAKVSLDAGGDPNFEASDCTVVTTEGFNHVETSHYRHLTGNRQQFAIAVSNCSFQSS